MKSFTNILPTIFLLVFFPSVFINCYPSNNEDGITLRGEWKFNPSDGNDFKNVNFNDQAWDTVKIPERLESQGYKNIPGIMWYRKKIHMPSSSTTGLKGIYFSNIADADEVYFNGSLIGKSGSFKKNGSIAPHLSRVYKIPEELIKNDKPNCIAVRVNKRYGPFIGIFNSSPIIGSFSILSKKALTENFNKSYFILFAALFILLLGIYHLILYFHLKTRVDYLIFSLTCFLLFLFEATVSFLPYLLIDNLNLVSKINFISLILSVAFLFFFILIYFGEKHPLFLKICFSVSTIFCLVILFIKDPNTNLKVFSIYFLFSFVLLFAIIYWGIKHVFLMRTRGNYFITIGLGIFVLTGLNDILVTTGLYYYNLITAYGFLTFVIGISISLGNDFARTYKAEQLKARTLENINQTSINLSSELRLEKLLDNSIKILKQHLQVERCTILLTNENSELTADRDKFFGDDLREPISEIDWVMDNNRTKPYIIKNVEDTFSGMVPEVGKKHRELMLVPMIHAKKRTGLMAFSKKKDKTRFTDDDKEFASIIAPQLALAVENATAYSHIEEKVKKQRDLLIMSEKMAAIGQLTSGIGHEINNPINFIISYVPPVRENVQTLVEILELYDKLHGDGGSEEQKNQILAKINEIKEKEKLGKKLPRILRSLDAITDGANRVASIVDSLKAYARTDALPRELDINSAMDKSIIILSNKLKNKVEVHKDYGKDVKATCYSSINQVLVNLLSNAADAIEEKGNIWIKTQVLRDKVRFSLRDDGKGMTKETQKKIFDPFYTTKGPTKGTGLGLSITYNIIYDQHHGIIEVQSEPGKGSIFTITIPKEITPS